MSAVLKPEVYTRAQKLVEAGRFHDVDEAVEAGIQALEEEDAAWKQYASEKIRRGLDDMEAGRTVPGERLLTLLRNARSTPA
jgi:Arc/MetJ-type ribon-helix-helix transcriptional regulator